MTWPPRRPGSRTHTPGKVRPRRVFTPLPGAASAHMAMPDRPSFSASFGEAGATLGWTDDPKNHLIRYKPPCTHRDCERPAMRWRRCGVCKEVFGRCGDHCSIVGTELHEQFDKHAHWQREGVWQCIAPDATRPLPMARAKEVRRGRR